MMRVKREGGAGKMNKNSGRRGGAGLGAGGEKWDMHLRSAHSARENSGEHHFVI